MAQSAVSISSHALVLLGAPPIASFIEGNTESIIAEQLYETTLLSMLTETFWHFATQTEQLARFEEEPNNSWKYMFQIPEDSLYVIECTDRNYEIYERKIFCNSESIKINYIYRPDEVDMPFYFTKALEYNLAAQFAIPLTGNVSRAEFYATIYQDAVKKARHADASQRPNNVIQSAPYLSARNNSGGIGF